MIRAIMQFGLLASLACAQDWVPSYAPIITSYVPLARAARITGDVVIRCTLNEDGAVATAEVVSGHALLQQQAKQNALGWRFRRTSAGDDRTVTLTYQFRLVSTPIFRNEVSFTVKPLGIIQIVGAPPPAME